MAVPQRNRLPECRENSFGNHYSGSNEIPWRLTARFMPRRYLSSRYLGTNPNRLPACVEAQSEAVPLSQFHRNRLVWKIQNLTPWSNSGDVPSALRSSETIGGLRELSVGLR